MSYRMFFSAALALGMFAGASALAGEDVKDATHDGKVVSIAGDKLVMANKEGKEHSHTLARDVRLTLDGKACKAADFKAGTRIRVTTRGADQQLATRVEGLDKNPEFASNRHDGKLVSISSSKLVMANKDGKEHSHMLTAAVKLTLDGKACQAADLKSGTRIRVTTESDQSNAVTRVEAIDKNLDFASL